MEGIAILLAAAALAFGIATRLRLPPIPLLLLAGVGVGRLAHVPEELLADALLLGVTFLLFVTGVELGPDRARTHARSAIAVGIAQFMVLGLAGFAATRLMGFDALDGGYIAFALTASSSLVVVRLLRQRRQMFEPFARLLTGVLLVQNLLLIVLIPALTLASAGLAAAGGGVVGALALVALAAAALRWLTPALRRLEHEEELLLLAILALLAAFMAGAAVLGLPIVVGAFLAGVTLSTFPMNAIARPQLAPVGDFFGAIFFTALGAVIGLPTLGQIGVAVLLAVLIVVVTPPLVAMLAERAGLSARPAIEAGLYLAQASEISLVVGLHGLLVDQIEPSIFTIVALVTALTMLLTPFLTADRVTWALMRLHPVRHQGDGELPREGHVLVLGSGATGGPLLETILAAGHEVIVVDDDPAIVDRLREAEIPVIRGDASDETVLERAGARHARIITSTIRRPEDNRRLLAYAQGVPVIVRVFEEEDARWVRELGGTPVLSSEAAADRLMEWWSRRTGGVAAPARE